MFGKVWRMRQSEIPDCGQGLQIELTRLSERGRSGDSSSRGSSGRQQPSWPRMKDTATVRPSPAAAGATRVAARSSRPRLKASLEGMAVGSVATKTR